MHSDLGDAADRLFADLFADDLGERFDAAVWRKIAEFGLPMALADEASGGAGATFIDAAAVIRAAGRCAACLPLAESMLAHWLLSRAGISAPAEPVTIGVEGGAWRLAREGARWRIRGIERGIPWARACGFVVVAETKSGPHVALLRANEFKAAPGRNLADEPRDTVAADCVIETVAPAPDGMTAQTPLALGAMMRANAIAGAAARALELTLAYAGGRIQFGKPIAAFQAVQHGAAQMAAQAAATAAAADLAAEASMNGDTLAIGAAKLRAAEAAGAIAALAHQIHGAMGVTREYPLHRFTTRLWAWRDEYGGESYWAHRIGKAVAALGADQAWPFITQAGR